MNEKAQSVDELSQLSTAALKTKLLQLTKDRDIEPLNKKVQLYKHELEPLFQELRQRNPMPTAEEQARIITGVWVPVWSTIPFQDTLPGRIHDQSYQIFHNDGYYANMARYAPGYKLSWLQKLSSVLLAYDLMIVQTFEVQNNQWIIHNVGIEQAFRLRGVPLSTDKAENWFSKTVQSKLNKASRTTGSSKAPRIRSWDKNTGKKYEKVFLATPQLEHLYMDEEFRLVKSQREAKQRPSYTIAVRRR